MQSSLWHRIRVWRERKRKGFIERWPLLWQRSPWKFSLVFGVLLWGAPVAFAPWIGMHLVWPEKDLSHIDGTMVVMAPTILLAGLAYGRFIWAVFDREHNKHVEAPSSARGAS